MEDRNGEKIVMIFENPYIYDGYSAYMTEDGELHNRWPEDDHRYSATEAFVNDLKEEIDA